MKQLFAIPFCFIAGVATAQDSPATILVLDGSGSMWGQIDGRTKIEIAQEVVAELMQSVPEDQEYGLTVYGHRTKGDCSDIETIIAPATGQAAAIVAAVNGISPKGKTPLSAAVIAAAKELRYSEEKATVILVSDGRETCSLDPCVVGQELEAAGVDFTAHVIGFDVDDPADRAQLQCLADETGGTFRLASNAAELTSALALVSVEPEPMPVTINFRATEGENGPEIGALLIWDISGDSGIVAEAEAGATQKYNVLAGQYQVSVLRPSDEETAEAEFTVTDQAMVVTLVLPVPKPLATLDAPETAPVGSLLDVGWEGPDAKSDYVSIHETGEKRYINYGYTAKGTPTEVRMPPLPGAYELRYISNNGGVVLATKTIEITPLDITIDAPDSAPLSSVLDVGYVGPDYKGDYIDIAEIGEKRYVNYGYTTKGNPTEVLMPAEPGEYLLRYVFGASDTVVAERPILVTAIDTQIIAPDTALAGSDVPVEWIGGDYKGDYISVAQPGEDRYIGYTYTTKGNPLTVKMPLDPGMYELRYQLGQRGVILATKPIEVTDVKVILDIPEVADAGANIVVIWDGPSYKGDYISIAGQDQDDNRYIGYTYTNKGSPLLLRMPSEPGEYEIRYIATGQGENVLARADIVTVPVSAAIMAVSELPAGQVLAFEWEGPDYEGDYIAIWKEGEDQYLSYVYTSKDSPAVIETPESPGNYELRYHTGKDNSVLATHSIKLTYQE